MMLFSTPSTLSPLRTTRLVIFTLLLSIFCHTIVVGATDSSNKNGENDDDDDDDDTTGLLLFENLSAAIRAMVPLNPWPTENWSAEGNTASPTPSSEPTPSSSSSSSTGGGEEWKLKPPAGSSWNIQLSTPPSPPGTSSSENLPEIYDMDMADTSPSTIAAFQAKNISVICYFSAGSREEYRSDAEDFPEGAVGKVMDGWPRERWVDVRDAGVREVMRRRMEVARGKGCEGVDPDNIDGYANDSGFDLTSSDAIDFIHFLAQTAHDMGLSYGLKNGGDLVEQVVDVAEWCVQEECVRYEECELYQPFIKANKPVFHLEYPQDDAEKEGKKGEEFLKKACEGQGTEGFSTLVKNLELDEWTERC